MNRNKYYILWVYYCGAPFLWRTADEIGEIENEIDILKSHSGKIDFGPYELMDLDKCVVTEHVFDDLMKNPINSIEFNKQEVN